MNPKEEPSSSGNADGIAVPPPTIVGPRPETASGTNISVPRGMERLLTLAGLSEDWKQKTLADPLRTAAEADIPLSPSESAILKAIPPQTLGQMILSCARNHLAPFKGTSLAAGTAAAALLAATNVGCDRSFGISPDGPQAKAEKANAEQLLAMEATKGIRPDAPLPRPTSAQTVAKVTPDIALDAALAQAVAARCAVMVIFPFSAQAPAQPAFEPHSRGMRPNVPASAFLTSVCVKGNESVSAAAASAHVLLVVPSADMNPVGAGWTGYVARLDRFGVKAEAPLVLFLAPDGTILRMLKGQTDEKNLVDAIQVAPLLLARWITATGKPISPAPPATKDLGPR